MQTSLLIKHHFLIRIQGRKIAKPVMQTQVKALVIKMEMNGSLMKLTAWPTISATDVQQTFPRRL